MSAKVPLKMTPTVRAEDLLQEPVKESYDSDTVRRLYPENLKVRFVQIVHRHGERTPLADHFIKHPYVRKPSPGPDYDEINISNRYENGTDPLNQSRSTEWNFCREVAALVKHVYPGMRAGLYRLDYGVDKEMLGLGKGSCHTAELTDKGHHSMLNLGRRLRELYVEKLGLLPERLDKQQLLARTTEVPRAIQSLQSLLLGLYPGETRSIQEDLVDSNGPQHHDIHFPRGYDPYERSKVIDIHTVREKKEFMIPSSRCKRWVDLGREFRRVIRQETDEEIKKLKSEGPLKSLFSTGDMKESINMHGQSNPDSAMSDGFPSIHSVFDDLMSRKAHGLFIPEDIDDQFLERLEHVLVREWWEPYCKSTELVRLAIGRFIKEMDDRIQKHIVAQSTQERESSSSGKDQVLKMAVYSAHDSTVAPLLCAFDVFDSRWPDFASNVIIELLEETDKTSDTIPQDSDRFLVRLKYNDKVVKMPGCQKSIQEKIQRDRDNGLSIDHLTDGTLCPVQGFSQIAKQFAPKNWQAECQRQEKK